MTINWEILVAAIAAIETGSTDLRATRPEPGRGVGPLQIHQCVIDDVNRIAGSQLRLQDAENPLYAKFICEIYLGWWAKRMDHTPSVEELARIWNGGPWGPAKPATADYGRRVAAMYVSIEKDYRLNALIAAAEQREKVGAL